jgi:hypothetical protein
MLEDGRFESRRLGNTRYVIRYTVRNTYCGDVVPRLSGDVRSAVGLSYIITSLIFSKQSSTYFHLPLASSPSKFTTPSPY